MNHSWWQSAVILDSDDNLEKWQWMLTMKKGRQAAVVSFLFWLTPDHHQWWNCENNLLWSRVWVDLKRNLWWWRGTFKLSPGFMISQLISFELRCTPTFRMISCHCVCCDECDAMISWHHDYMWKSLTLVSFMMSRWWSQWYENECFEMMSFLSSFTTRKSKDR